MKIVAFLDRWSSMMICFNLVLGIIFAGFCVLDFENWFAWYIDGFVYCLSNSCDVQNIYYWENLVQGTAITVPFALVVFFSAYKLTRQQMPRIPVTD